ncbi:MAG: PfkB family carbohydrate kinase [Phycisphaerales bacterium]|jgi:sugar/nucleoside kinase (ribokinase family)|nr:PfkB family carbohydrate kinase [Phycisphaerales bacterium]
MSLIVTGTIGIDTVHTPHGSAERVLGGSCAYFAAAASHYAPTRLVGVVGDDWPEAHRKTLESFSGIDLGGLEVRSGSLTFRWGGRYFDNMNDRETLFTELGVLEEHPPEVPEHFADSRYVFLANTHPAVQLGLLEQFPDRALAVADTMDLWINIAHDDLLQLLSAVDGLVINDSEASQLTEERNAITAARRILEMGPTFVVVKKGEHGCVLVHRDGTAVGVLPAFPVEASGVVDPTGAGDSFAGGMMGHLAGSDRTDVGAIHEALAWGTVTASCTIGSFGLEGLRTVARADLDERMSAFQSAAVVGPRPAAAN